MRPGMHGAGGSVHTHRSFFSGRIQPVEPQKQLALPWVISSLHSQLVHHFDCSVVGQKEQCSQRRTNESEVHRFRHSASPEKTPATAYCGRDQQTAPLLMKRGRDQQQSPSGQTNSSQYSGWYGLTYRSFGTSPGCISGLRSRPRTD